MKIATPPSFTEKELAQIDRALPEGANPYRLSLLPRVIREWAETDLREYADFEDYRASTPERTKRYEKVICAARALLTAIDTAIEAEDHIIIAHEMGEADKTIPMPDRRAHYTT